jgi:aminopeptidase N
MSEHQLSEVKKVHLRADYQSYPFYVDKTELEFHLAPAHTLVKAKLAVRAKPGRENSPMILNGVGLQLKKVAINGVSCSESQFSVDADQLTIHQVPSVFVLETEVIIKPRENSSLEGLYVSNLAFFTQCEAEGFRRITYYPDRPDVLSVFEVKLIANVKDYPILLSNGNLKETEILSDGLHMAVWYDPFPKPCYLFALVAGQFYCHEKVAHTKSGQEKLLQIYVREEDANKTEAAMKALEDAMSWDEQRFGLSLDLERYMIVAVSDFNMGAMENKGLNIFNTRYVLANPDVATDADYANVEAVVGHEYFHNWTGNRVTCRDWFQLSLKEGLTVFRDQEFSADMMARSASDARVLKRLDDVGVLQQVQFAEDAGPMAHPIRPDSYEEISNFYTATVYEKGAEVVRMLHTILGEDGFMKGMRRYIEQHDGKAVTCDDFVDAMALANGRDLSQFKRWYEQAGTPNLLMSTHYDKQKSTLTVHFAQDNPHVGIEMATRPVKLPLLIPILFGLVDSKGDAVSLVLERNGMVEETKATTVLLEMTEAEQSFVFHRVPEGVVPSVLRQFSAPVRLKLEMDDSSKLKQNQHMAKYDEDTFNRFNAVEQIAKQVILAQYLGKTGISDQPELLVELFSDILQDTQMSPALKAEFLTLPSEALLGDEVRDLDPSRMREVRVGVRRTLASTLKPLWEKTLNGIKTDISYQTTVDQVAFRSLRHVVLGFLCELPEADGGAAALSFADKLYQQADNLTDRVAAISALLIQKPAHELEVLKDMYSDFKHEPLVMDRWFQLQAAARHTKVEHIKLLQQHPLFSMNNPNRMRSLLSVFFSSNSAQFHCEEGYALWEECVIYLNTKNPQIAARVARVLERYRHYAPHLEKQMQTVLERLLMQQNLATDVREVIVKALQF